MAPRLAPRAPLCAAAAAAAGRADASAPEMPPPGAAAQKRDGAAAEQQQEQQQPPPQHPPDQDGVPSTLPGLLSTFFSQPAILGATAAIALPAAARLSRAAAEPFVPQEIGLCLAAVALWCVCEWLIHCHLLHPLLGEDEHEEEGRRRRLGPLREALRATHAEHHARPYLHVSVDGGPLIAAFMGATGAGWCLAFWLLGSGGGAGGGGGGGGLSSPFLPSVLSSYWASGLLYEFAHFAAHTRYAPAGRAWPARWLRAVRRHHLLHHCRSEAHWLAFTAPGVDALFGTLPDRRAGGGWPAMTPMARRAAAAWRKSDGGA